MKMSDSTINNFDLPPELGTKPMVLVGVSGLDTVNNAVHKAIWETFSSNRRIERAPVSFKLISNAHEFPVIKPKRNSYDWYIPKGILKKNWMNKHLYEIPAVIVIFYELDWNDSLWNEKMIECASRVQSMRAALEGRSTRITVVLIQNTIPLPPGEDLLAAERAVSLCASCELNATSLFVLPHGDHLQGYAVRLENAFYEFAQNYYHNEAKIVRSHKDYLNKSTHQFLYVRHQFKMGFLYELKQDIMTAHKHYTHAYNNLLEIRIVDTNASEIRTIAGFINYKLCRLLFALNLPRDAISHFKSHVERFKHRIGFQELSYEHYAWLSKQFAVFGDVFDEAVKLGLPAVQTQHPGIYYQQATHYAITRKKICQETCMKVKSYPQPDPLENSVHMDFYGQRPWRPGKINTEAPDQQLEMLGIQALQFLEKQVNHSNIIISLYGLAISQFKTYRCPRTRKHLVLQMADEYYNSQDYGKALTLLTHMLWDFRLEKWWYLMSNILEKAIKCAFLTANVQDYMLLALEVLGKHTCTEIEIKKRIYENFNRILKREIPFGDSNLPHDMLQKAIINWQPVFATPTMQISLDLTNITACIETKARFMQKVYEVDQKVTVEIYSRNTSFFPITLNRVAVTINTPGFTSEYAVNNSSLNNISLELKNNDVKKFIVEFYPDPNDVSKDIQIGFIVVRIGSPECNLELKFNGTNDTNEIYPELLHFKRCDYKLDFDNIRPLPVATLVPRRSNLCMTFSHNKPALLGEWYEVQIIIDNKEKHTIKNLEVILQLVEEEVLTTTELSCKLTGIPENVPLKLILNDTMEQDEKFTTQFYLRAHKVSVKNVQLNITYILDSEKPVISTKTEALLIPVVQPFEVTTSYLSTLMTEVDRFYIDEEFGIMPSIASLSPWPLMIENTQFDFNPIITHVESNLTSPLNNKILEQHEVGTELILATCQKVSEQNIPIGHYIIRWKRVEGYATTTKIALNGCPSENIPIKLGVSLPAHGLVRTPALIEYHIENKSNHLTQLEVKVDGSEGFMYAGHKQFLVNILPHSMQHFKYNLYPLIAGSVALPKMSLKIPEGGIEGPDLRQEQLNALVERSLPRHLFVIPQAKGNPKIPEFIQARKITIK